MLYTAQEPKCLTVGLCDLFILTGSEAQLLAQME